MSRAPTSTRGVPGPGAPAVPVPGPRPGVDLPFAPRRTPFFYGWVIVAAGSLGAIASVPGQTVGVSAFTDHLIASLGVDRVALSRAYLAGTVGSGLMLPFAGWLYDARGARFVVCVASPALGATLLLLSFADTLATALQSLVLGPGAEVERALLGPGFRWTVLALGFLSLRFWGQGVLTMVSRAMVGKWFRRRRGLASGISGVVVSGAFAGAPVAFDALIREVGWRGAWRLAGLAVGIGMTFLGWVLYRDRPEDCGLRMDGDPEPVPADGRPGTGVAIEDDEPSATLGQAMASAPFWIANLSFVLASLTVTAFTFHIVDIGARVGLARGEALRLLVPLAPTSVVATIASGWLSDRVRLRWLVQAQAAGIALGCGGLADLAAPTGQALTVGGFGVAMGVLSSLLVVIWPRYYGRGHLGAISSVNMTLLVVGSALGPWIFALSARGTGNYGAALTACAITGVVAVLAGMGLQNPRGRDRAPAGADAAPDAGE